MPLPLYPISAPSLESDVLKERWEGMWEGVGEGGVHPSHLHLWVAPGSRQHSSPLRLLGTHRVNFKLMRLQEAFTICCLHRCSTIHTCFSPMAKLKENRTKGKVQQGKADSLLLCHMDPAVFLPKGLCTLLCSHPRPSARGYFSPSPVRPWPTYA